MLKPKPKKPAKLNVDSLHAKFEAIAEYLQPFVEAAEEARDAAEERHEVLTRLADGIDDLCNTLSELDER